MYEFDSLDKELQDQIVEKVRKQYSAATVDHWLHPRNFGRLEDPDGHAVCSGTCGEIMEIFVRLKAGRIAEAGFLTDGCITATASGSMAVELATSRSAAKARAISPDDILAGLEGLPGESQQAANPYVQIPIVTGILEGLEGLPDDSRHCAVLAAKTLRAAIDEAVALEKEPWKKSYPRRNPNE